MSGVGLIREDEELAGRLTEQCKDLIFDATYGYALPRRLAIAALVFATGFAELTLALIRAGRTVPPNADDVVHHITRAPWISLVQSALAGRGRREDALLAQEREAAS